MTGASGFVGRAVVTALRARRIRGSRRGAAAAAAGFRPRESRSSSIRICRSRLTGRRCSTASIKSSILPASPYRRRPLRRFTTASIGRRPRARSAAAARNGIRHFVFVSSIRAQSGPSADHALTERDEPAPTDAYGRSKLAAEAAVRAAGVPFTILRPALLYGPGVKGNFALLLRAALSRWPLPVKDFVNRRSLLGIDNFISAMSFVLSESPTRGRDLRCRRSGNPAAASRRDGDVAASAEAGGR